MVIHKPREQVFGHFDMILCIFRAFYKIRLTYVAKWTFGTPSLYHAHMVYEWHMIKVNNHKYNNFKKRFPEAMNSTIFH